MRRLLQLFLFIAALLATGAASSVPKTAPLYSAEQVRADLQQLYASLQRGSYNLFAHTPKACLDSAYQAYLASLNKPLTLLEAQKLFMRFTALAAIAHTRIDFPSEAYKAYLAEGGKTLPIEFAITPQTISIADYFDRSEASPIAVGDQLLAVDGEPVAKWLPKLQAYIAADNEEIMASLSEGLVVPLLWLHDGERDHYELTLKSASTGTVYSYSQVTLPHELQSTGLAAKDSPHEEKVRDFRIVEGEIGYLKPGPFYNVYATSHTEIWDPTEFHQFIDRAFTEFKQQQVEKVLIDIRANPGGTNSFSDHMLAWFADKPFKFASDFRIKVSDLSRASNARRLEGEGVSNATSVLLEELYAKHELGDIVSFPLETAKPHGGDRSLGDAKIYVLIDRYSYSNAVSVAAIAQDYDFATVIGEKTGDLATTYAAMETFKLDQTGIEVGYPKAHIIRPNGDLKADGVTPDSVLPFLADASSTEESLQRIVEWVKHN